MLKLPEAVALVLEGTSRPIITDHGLSLLLHNIFETRLVAGRPVALRNKVPTRGHYLSVLKYLRENEIIQPDADFYRYDDDDHRCAVFQVLGAPDGAPEEIASIADPFCYLSHISAMEHHTLVPRNSEELVFSTPAPGIWRGLRDAKMEEDYGPGPQNYDIDELRLPLQRIAFPKIIRGKSLVRHDTKYLDRWTALPGSQVKVANIGDTFAQMLERPAWCGGMKSVLEIFERSAEGHRTEVLDAIDRCERPIVKVRAGYVFEERLHWGDNRISAWRKYAQRGSSRVLDPERPFAPRFSENWMLSLNAL